MQHLSQSDLTAHVIQDIAAAISERPGETEQQRMMRCFVATHLILGLSPVGLLEVMLAGHAVMFHALIIDGIHDMWRAEAETMRRGTRSSVVGLERAFHQNLGKLKHCQDRRSKLSGDDVPTDQQVDAHSTPVETVTTHTEEPPEQPVRVASFSSDVAGECATPPTVVGADAVLDTVHSVPTARPIEADATTVPPVEAEHHTPATPADPSHLNRAQRRQLRRRLPR